MRAPLVLETLLPRKARPFAFILRDSHLVNQPGSHLRNLQASLRSLPDSLQADLRVDPQASRLINLPGNQLVVLAGTAFPDNTSMWRRIHA